MFVCACVRVEQDIQKRHTYVKRDIQKRLIHFLHLLIVQVCLCVRVCVWNKIQKRSTDYLDAFVRIQIRAKRALYMWKIDIQKRRIC